MALYSRHGLWLPSLEGPRPVFILVDTVNIKLREFLVKFEWLQGTCGYLDPLQR